jgi:hypothetical protein
LSKVKPLLIAGTLAGTAVVVWIATQEAAMMGMEAGPYVTSTEQANVRYVVEHDNDHMRADLVWGTGLGTWADREDAKLPFEASVPLLKGDHAVIIAAKDGSPTGELTCKIFVDGKLVDEETTQDHWGDETRVTCSSVV